MPLSTAVGGLLAGIETAYNNAVENGAKEDNSNGTQESLGADMGEAIDQYYSQALVTTKVTVKAGQTDSALGATTAEGTGSGTGSLSGLDATSLKDSLYNAFKDAAETGSTKDPIPQLSEDVGNAVHVYMVSGVVTTAVTVDGGQPTAGLAPSSIVPAPYPGSTFTGKVRFESGDVTTLKSDIETAYNNAKKNGETGASLEALADEIHTAIDKFALTAIVETDGEVIGGQTVIPYATPAGPIFAVTNPGSGTGEGELS